MDIYPIIYTNIKQSWVFYQLELLLPGALAWTPRVWGWKGVGGRWSEKSEKSEKSRGLSYRPSQSLLQWSPHFEAVPRKTEKIEFSGKVQSTVKYSIENESWRAENGQYPVDLRRFYLIT